MMPADSAVSHLVVPAEQVRHLVLIGMMGSGKTTIGRIIESATGWPYLDNDELVRRISGREPATIRTEDGEDQLHDLETQALLDALRRVPPTVIGAAAAVVLDDKAVTAIQARATAVWLRARPHTLRARIGAGEGRRAEATDVAWLARKAAAREGAYTAIADLVVDVDDIDAVTAADRVLAWLAAPPPPSPDHR